MRIKPPLRKDQQSFRTIAVPMHCDAAFSRVRIFAFTCALSGPSIFTQPGYNSETPNLGYIRVNFFIDIQKKSLFLVFFSKVHGLCAVYKLVRLRLSVESVTY